jgi:hypothetical protein
LSGGNGLGRKRPHKPRSNRNSAGMGTEILRSIRISPIFPFAMVTVALGFLVFWVSNRHYPNTASEIGRVCRLVVLIAFWRITFYELFLEP